jgi:hypothetical protein
MWDIYNWKPKCQEWVDILKYCAWHILKIYMFVKDDGVDGSNWSNLIKLDLEFYDVGGGPWELGI